MAFIFWDWRNSSSIRCRLVRSRMKPVKMRLPLAAASPTASCIGKVVPSLRWPVTTRPNPMMRLSPVAR